MQHQHGMQQQHAMQQQQQYQMQQQQYQGHHQQRHQQHHKYPTAYTKQTCPKPGPAQVLSYGAQQPPASRRPSNSSTNSSHSYTDSESTPNGTQTGGNPFAPNHSHGK